MSSTQVQAATATPAPTSIIQAVDFLTRPLLTIYSPAKVFSLRMLLYTALSVLFSQRKPSTRFTITLAPGPVAPRALYPSCMEAGIRWADWIMVLGGHEFDLIIEEDSVSTRVVGQKQTVVWSNKSSSVEATTTRSETRATLRSMVDSALKRAETRTLAQQLLTSEHEEKEADELFACLAQTHIISPTPTRDAFPIKREALEVSSRPSSRSSQASSSGFSIYSDDSYATSVSSSSHLKPGVYKPPFVRSHRPTLSSSSSISSFSTASSVSTPVSDDSDEEPATVYVDQNKKEVTKYLYQGGVSTVLTGGVMLGSPATSKKPSGKPTSSGSWRRRV